MMPSLEQKLEMLIQAVQLVAADSGVQTAALPRYVQTPDEIALIFEDCCLLMDELQNAGMLDSASIALLRQIDALFNQMSSPGNGGSWTPSAFSKSE